MREEPGDDSWRSSVRCVKWNDEIRREEADLIMRVMMMIVNVDY